MTDSVKAKIAKLLNMTVENGCSEDEAANAMRMAAGIAARAGIELASCMTPEQAKQKATIKRTFAEMKVYESMAAEAAACLYGVECNAPNYGKNGYWFVGRQDNIDLAEQTMLWLVQQIETLYKQHLPKGLDKRTRAEYRKSFKDACALRVWQRADALVKDMQHNEQAAQNATGQNALVVAGYFQTLKSENDEYWNERQRASEAARQARIAARHAQMTPEQVAAEELAMQRLREELLKKAKKAQTRAYKEPRERSIKYGVGTQAGTQAGERVKLRDEIN